MNRVLIAGVGNIFQGDDGFGCEVAQRLGRQSLPREVTVQDFGIRSLDLAYALRDGFDVVILVDITDRGGAPGSLYLIEPERAESGARDAGLIAPHDMSPDTLLDMVATMGRDSPRVLILACQPEYLGGEEGYMGLSDVVSAAVDPAIQEVRRIMKELLETSEDSAPARRSPDRQLSA